MAEVKKKIKIAVGDVFAIPLSSGGYGVGRLIYISDRWRLAQFFALRLDAPELPASLLDVGDVMPVHNIVALRIEEGAWPVLKHGMLDALPDLDSLIFYRGLPAQRTYLKLNGELLSAPTGWVASPVARSRMSGIREDWSTKTSATIHAGAWLNFAMHIAPSGAATIQWATLLKRYRTVSVSALATTR